jgi:hypothetical protein
LQLRRVLLAVALVLGGCATNSAPEPTPQEVIEERMSSWMGSTVSDLIASWGPPWRTINVGSEGVVYVWVNELWKTDVALPYKEHIYHSPGTLAENILRALNTYNEMHRTETVMGFQMFWANPNGVLYRWAWRAT